MLDYSPFSVTSLGKGEYQILAKFDAPELQVYQHLFESYQPVSLVDIAALIVEEKAPSLLDYISYDEEGYWLDIQVERSEDLPVFASAVCSIYRNLEDLKLYVQRAAQLA